MNHTPNALPSLVMLSLGLLLGCSRETPTTRMVTVDGVEAVIQVARAYPDDLAPLTRGFTATANSIASQLNAENPDSEVARLNLIGNAGRMALSRPVFRALDLGRAYSQWTDYAYDYTAAPLIDLWQTGAPEYRALEKALQQTGMHRVEVSEPASILLTASGMRITPGDLAFAYTLDVSIVELRQRAKGAYAVRVPGMMRREGTFPPNETPFLPLRVDRETLGVLPLKIWTAAVARSPSPRSLRQTNAPPADLIDPRSGQPVQSARLAVAAGPLTTKAYALAEALLISDPERSERLLMRFPDYEVLVVPATPAGTLWMTPGFQAEFIPSTSFPWTIRSLTRSGRASPSR